MDTKFMMNGLLISDLMLVSDFLRKNYLYISVGFNVTLTDNYSMSTKSPPSHYVM